MGISRIFAALLLTLLGAANAVGQIELDGAKYPSYTNLAYEFLPNQPLQVGGTCHIFAAAALFEAACYRATGSHIKISEAYLINRHLSSQLAEAGSGLRSSQIQDGILGDKDGGDEYNDVSRVFEHSVCAEQEFPMDFTLLKSLKDIVLAIEGQAPVIACEVRKKYAVQEKDLISEIQKDKSLAHSEEAVADKRTKNVNDLKGTSNKFLLEALTSLGNSSGIPGDIAMFLTFRKLARDDNNQKVKPVRNQAKALESHVAALQITVDEINARLQGELDSLNEEIAQESKRAVQRKLNEQIKNHSDLDPSPSQAGGYRLTSKDAGIKSCFSRGLKAQKERFSPRLALDLLSKGIPFICGGYFKFPGGQRGEHATTVIGYAYDQSKRNNLNYTLRDSNNTVPETGWELNCDTVTYITLGN